ncbi:hypothetical protein FRC11_005506 [Ceratobasidium sp. 423]|nr:hypothetical protein FRC11_005506 [Ceratobasidium sp. 423]
MGKVTTFCQISGCSPEIEDVLDFESMTGYTLSGASEPEKSDYAKIQEALKLLVTGDEKMGAQALSIIGPFNDNNKLIWGFEENPNELDEILEEAEGHVRELPGCRIGDMFDLGYCEGPNGEDDGALISYGGYFYVQTNILAILAGATQGRVSVQRLWRLAMIKGYYDAHNYYVLPGVDYGPIHEYLEQFPWFLGGVDREELIKMGGIGPAEDIAEVPRKRGFWMWMRPDRSVFYGKRSSQSLKVFPLLFSFPVDPVAISQPTTSIT